MRLAKSADLLVRIGADISDFQNKIRGLQGSLKGIGDGLQRAGRTMTKTFTAPIVATSAAIAGISFKKGFDRLTAIDTAKAKLEALGHSGKNVDLIMDSALTSVKGTSFGLGEAATTAANAVAAGIKPGKELTRYLTLAGDAAAVAGVDMAEMGSILNKVQTSNKAYNSELQQLSERGLPIYQWLADEAGTTEDAIFDMASNGEISSEMLLNAIEKNIGGSAKVMGEKSFVAGIANIGAAIGRLGASFLDAGGKGGGFFSVIKDNIPNVIDFIDSLGDKAESAGVKFGNFVMNIIDKIMQVKQWFDELSPSTQALIGKVILFGTIALAAIGPVLTIVGKVINFVTMLSGAWTNVIGTLKLVGGAFAGLSGPVLIVIGVIAGLIALFTVLYQKNEAFRDLVNTAWEAIKEIISTVIQAVSDFVMEIFGGLVDWWNENNELIREVVQIVWDKIQKIITKVLDIIVPIIQAAWDVIKIATETVWNIIKTVIDTVIKVILGIIKTVMQLITGDWEGAWNTIKNIASTLLGAIKNIISNLLSGAFNIIKSILGNIKSIFSTIFNSLKGVVSNAFNKVRNAVSDGMSKAYDKVTGFFTKFKDAGKNIVQSIADGIESAVGKVTEAISDVTQKIRDFLPFSPAKEGPLQDIHRLDFEGPIGDGIKRGTPKIQALLNTMLSVPDAEIHGEYTAANSTAANRADNIIKLLSSIKSSIDKQQKIIVEIYGDNEAIRAYVNEQNAVEGILRKF